MTALRQHGSLKFLCRFRACRSAQVGRRLPSIKEVKIFLNQIFFVLPVKPNCQGFHLPIKAVLLALMHELCISHLPSTLLIQIAEHGCSRFQPPSLDGPQLEVGEQLRAMSVKLLKVCDVAAVMVQSLPQRSHIALPIQLAAHLEQVCTLNAHRPIAVQHPAPRPKCRPELFSQHGLEVEQRGLADLLAVRLLLLDSLRLAPRRLLLLVPPHLYLQPLELQRG
mmetsp:Transcript_81689/g.149256  ORF Transcript_81689/g.149256 Transcript_81689/m.149256 type:complete len:223 (-) Transcript_81689:849-1517(-)